MQVARIGGPAAAGVLIASVGLPAVYAIDLATFAFSLVCLSMVRAVPPPPDADRPSLRAVATGLRYARSRPELLGTYLVDINAMFFGMPHGAVPVHGRQARRARQVLGLLYASTAVGVAAGHAHVRVGRSGPSTRTDGRVAAGAWGLGHHRRRARVDAVARRWRASSWPARPT